MKEIFTDYFLRKSFVLHATTDSFAVDPFGEEESDGLWVAKGLLLFQKVV